MPPLFASTLSGVGTNLIGTDPNATTNALNNTNFQATGAIKGLDYGDGLRLEIVYTAQRATTDVNESS